jgi:hypothetical protein
LIEGKEIAEGVWVFRGAPGEPNWGVALTEGRALVIDPPSSSLALDATERFVEEARFIIEALVYTSDAQEVEPAVRRWTDAALLTPAMFHERVSLLASIGGWEAVPFYEQERGARMGVYNVWERVLFCGDMLSDMLQNEGIPSLAAGSKGYIDSLKSVERLDVKLLVPSRGTLAQGKRAIRARIQNDNNYVYDVRSRVISSILSEVSLERVLEVTRSLYEDFLFLNEHIDNIRWVWDELSTKEDEPDGKVTK